MTDILLLTILAILCGADTGDEIIEEFGKAKIDWLKESLELGNAIPSHDTLNRVFSMLGPQNFNSVFSVGFNH